MRVSTKRILSILTGLAFLLGALFVYLGLIRDEVAAAEKVRGLLVSKEILLGNQERAVTQVRGLIDEFKNFTQLQATVSRAVPNGASAIQALRQIEAIARSANVVISGLDFSAAAAPRTTAAAPAAGTSVVKRLRTLEVRVRADGSYANLKQFVKLLETSVRVADVRRMNYTPGGLVNSNDTITLEAQMYYQE